MPRIKVAGAVVAVLVGVAVAWAAAEQQDAHCVDRDD